MSDHQINKAFTLNKSEWVQHTLRHQKKVNGKWEVITTVYYRRKTR